MPCKSPYILRLKQPLDMWKIEELGYSPTFIAVPCGKCVDCLAKKSRDLFVRMYYEVKYRPASYFITLTYSDEFLPYTRTFKPTLSKRDLQNFLKRLRYNTGNNDIMYLACGEYGDKGHRPHYHAILMFEQFQTPEEVYNLIEKSWFKGCRIQIAPAEPATLFYCVKYLIKDDKMLLSHSRTDDNNKPLLPFAVWSKGLGESYICRPLAKFLLQSREFYTYINGVKYGLPKYLRTKIFDYILKNNLASTDDLISILKENFNLLWDSDNEEMEHYKKAFGDRIGYDYYHISQQVKKNINLSRKKNRSSL